MNARILAAIVIAVIVIGIAAVSFRVTTNITNSISSNPIHIGAILILSGEGSSWGTAERNGIQMAVEQVNSEGGINGRPLEINYQDDRGDPTTAVSAFRNLEARQINMIIGTTWSRTGLAVAPLANSSRIIMISPSLGVREFNEQSPYLFNLWPHDYLLSERLAEIIYGRGFRNVAVVGAQEVWVRDQTSAFTRRFNQLGGNITLLFEPNTDNRDLRTEAARIRDSNADAIVFLTDGVQVGTIMAQRIREQGIERPSFSVTLTQDDITASRNAYDGTIFLTSLTPSAEFEAAYRARFTRDLEIGGDSAYDAVMLLTQAIRETNSTDSTVLATYLNSVQTFNGVSGNMTSDGRGGFIRPYAARLIVNGTVQYFSNLSPVIFA